MSTISGQMETHAFANACDIITGKADKAAGDTVASSSSSSRCRGAASSSSSRCKATVEVGVQCEPQDGIAKLEQEKAELQRRLEFVEALVGPTETQRKMLQDQVIAARSATLRAKYRGAGLPTKVAGRLDESLLWSCGLSDRDAGLLQGGCLPNKDGILQDVSLLGDPSFRPYDQSTGELRWHARGGMLQLSLGEVRNRFGDDIAHDVVRCAKELDKWDSSRRVGVELPWHPLEDRELEPAEVIDLMDRELSLHSSMMYSDDHDSHQVGLPSSTSQPEFQENSPSPYAVVNAQPRRGRGRRARGGRSHAPSARGSNIGVGASRGAHVGARSGSAGSAAAQGGSSAVVALPRLGVDSARRGPLDGGRCGLPGHLRHRIQESLDHSLLGCHDRIRLV